MKQHVVTVILGAGAAKRFWPVSAYKSMIKFLGKSLLEHNLELLGANGFSDIVIVANPQDEAEMQKIRAPGMNIKIIVQKEPKGMADAVLQVKNIVGSKSCFIISGEDIVEESLYKQFAQRMNEASMLVAGKYVNEYLDVGYLKLDGNRLKEVIEKPGKGNEPSKLVNLVFHYFPDPSLFFTALEGATSEKDDVYEKALSVILTQTEAKVVSYDGFWQPTKYPWHILDSMEYLLAKKCTSHRGKNVEIKSNVVIDGPVYIEDNVRIFENTKIVGPAFIGHDTIIGNNNIIRQSNIGSGCVTGFNTDITRSYVGDNCWFHSNYIGDSVLEGNVSMGSGSVLANLRLDEGTIWSVVKGERMDTMRTKLGAVIGVNVRIGVNTSVMPGVKIGKNSMIGAGIVVDKDIPDESFCLLKQSYSVTSNTRGTHPSSRDSFKKRL